MSPTIEAVPIDVPQDPSSVFRYFEPDNASGPPAVDTDLRHCETGALTNGLGLFVQLLLAFIAFSCLIAKRYCEPVSRRRSWIVWFLDTSKQIIGAGTMHASNVLLSEVLYAGDPCTWYVVNFLLDSTIGLGLIFIGLRGAYLFGKWMSWDSLKYGEYGDPARMTVWVKQCSAYLVVILMEKCVIVLLTLLPIWRRVTRYVMDWTTSADVELVLVMFVIPLVVNAIIFWVVDNFLMQHKFDDSVPSRDEPLPAHECMRPTSSWRCSSCCCAAGAACCLPSGRGQASADSSTAKYSRLTGQSRQRLRHSASSDRDEDAEDEERGYGNAAASHTLSRRVATGSFASSSSSTIDSSGADVTVLLLPSSPARGSGARQPQKL